MERGGPLPDGQISGQQGKAATTPTPGRSLRRAPLEPALRLNVPIRCRHDAGHRAKTAPAMKFRPVAADDGSHPDISARLLP